jgi:hypothetical protein
MRTGETARSWRPVFSLTERDGRTFWSRIGVAFDNSDGSVTLNVDAIPISGKLQIRDRDHRDEERAPRRPVLRMHGKDDLVGG